MFSLLVPKCRLILENSEKGSFQGPFFGYRFWYQKNGPSPLFHYFLESRHVFPIPYICLSYYKLLSAVRSMRQSYQQLDLLHQYVAGVVPVQHQ